MEGGPNFLNASEGPNSENLKTQNLVPGGRRGTKTQDALTLSRRESHKEPAALLHRRGARAVRTGILKDDTFRNLF